MLVFVLEQQVLAFDEQIPDNDNTHQTTPKRLRDLVRSVLAVSCVYLASVFTQQKIVKVVVFASRRHRKECFVRFLRQLITNRLLAVVGAGFCRCLEAVAFLAIFVFHAPTEDVEYWPATFGGGGSGVTTYPDELPVIVEAAALEGAAAQHEVPVLVGVSRCAGSRAQVGRDEHRPPAATAAAAALVVGQEREISALRGWRPSLPPDGRVVLAAATVQSLHAGCGNRQHDLDQQERSATTLHRADGCSSSCSNQSTVNDRASRTFYTIHGDISATDTHKYRLSSQFNPNSTYAYRRRHLNSRTTTVSGQQSTVNASPTLNKKGK